jgi:AraC-like DNA-binding protein
MRPYLEKLPLESDSSLSRLNRRLDDAIPFQWHHHPEFELTLTLNSRGQRFIGDHVGEYDDGDLVLVGPNLPHTWFSREKIEEDKPHVALVMWFHPDWARQMARDFVEFRNVAAMLAQAGGGLQFTPQTAGSVRGMFESLFSCSPAERLLTLLSVLHRLSSDAAQPLASTSPLQDAAGENRERIDRVLTHIHTHYARPVPLPVLADIAALSPSGLHRLFIRHTGRSISDYIIHMRIGDACARLSGTAQPIRHIADVVGYNSLANFNRQFRSLKGMTPRDYRKLFNAR